MAVVRKVAVLALQRRGRPVRSMTIGCKFTGKTASRGPFYVTYP